jgi:hypothetical protein
MPDAAPARDGAAAIGCGLVALLAAALPLPAAADFRSELLSSSELEVRALWGYPRTQDSYFGALTLGVELRARKGERSVRIELEGDASTERTLRVPAGETRRIFLYLPSWDSWTDTHAQLRVRDLNSGWSGAFSVDGPFERGLTIARLGPLTAAMNLADPWSLVGALDAHLPDHWQGLAGLHAIAIEQGWAESQPLDWRVLLDWVAMGGALLVATEPDQLARTPPWASQLPFAETVEKSSALGVVQRVGLGAIARLPPKQLASIGARFLETLGTCRACADSPDHDPLQELGSQRAAERLGELIRPPGWTILALLSTFVVLVGPVGFALFLRRRPRPFAYIVFAALTGSTFSVTVFAADVLENGLRTKCASSSLRLIDQLQRRELGFEDVSLYAPLNVGQQLAVTRGAQLLLPSSLYGPRHDPIEIQSSGSRDRMARVIPVRQASEVAARWLAPFAGQLIVTEAEGGVWAENQLGRALRDLLVWHGGDSYYAATLSKGARVRLQPLAAGAVQRHLPQLASGGVEKHAQSLFDEITGGRRGRQRFVAAYDWSPEELQLGLQGVLTSKPGQHWIAGVY